MSKVIVDIDMLLDGFIAGFRGRVIISESLVEIAPFIQKERQT